MPKQVSDPVAPWFIAAEAEGEYIGMRFGRLAPGASEPEWCSLSHAECDGFGAIWEIFRKRGVMFDSLPQAKHPAKPSMFSFFRLLQMHLRPRRRLKWRKLGPSEKRSCYPEPPPAMAWHAFDESTTSQMREVCSRSDVSVNPFLLKKLTETILPYLEEASPAVPWMIPVNMRGRVACDPETANHTSYVSVKVRPNDTVHDVHQSIYSALEREEHCTNWFGFELGRYTTHPMRRFLYRNELVTTQWNLGVFSNLGVWDSEKKITQPDCLGAWMATSPVLRCQLVGVVCFTFQNRLSMTLSIHPELTTDPAVAKLWMQNWVREIESDLSRRLPEATATREEVPA